MSAFTAMTFTPLLGICRTLIKSIAAATCPNIHPMTPSASLRKPVAFNWIYGLVMPPALRCYGSFYNIGKKHPQLNSFWPSGTEIHRLVAMVLCGPQVGGLFIYCPPYPHNSPLLPLFSVIHTIMLHAWRISWEVQEVDQYAISGPWWWLSNAPQHCGLRIDYIITICSSVKYIGHIQYAKTQLVEILRSGIRLGTKRL